MYKRFIIFCISLISSNIACAQHAKVKAVIIETHQFFKEISVPAECKISKSKDYIADHPGIVDFVLRNKEYVKKGELIFAMDKRISKANTDKSYEEYRSATQTYERDKKLADKRVITQEKLEQAKLSYHSAKAKYEESLKSDNTKIIYAPFDGQISVIKFKEGEIVKEGDFLFSIVSGEEKFVRFEIPQFYEIRNGSFKGKIKARSEEYELENIQISDHLSAGKSGYSGTGEIIGKNNLKHNSYVTAQIKFDIHNGLGVPEKSIFIEGGKHKLYLINEKSEARQVEVNALDRNDGFIEIKSSDLKPGERVVTEGVQKIEDGQLVEVME